MIKMVIEKGTAKNKKFKAIFYDDKGNRYSDYTIHKDKERRSKYRSRHKGNLSKGTYTSPSHLSFYLLWGDSTSLNTNIKKYKNMFKLK